jgi:hypothetical protein
MISVAAFKCLGESFHLTVDESLESLPEFGDAQVWHEARETDLARWSTDPGEARSALVERHPDALDGEDEGLERVDPIGVVNLRAVETADLEGRQPIVAGAPGFADPDHDRSTRPPQPEASGGDDGPESTRHLVVALRASVAEAGEDALGLCPDFMYPVRRT